MPRRHRSRANGRRFRSPTNYNTVVLSTLWRRRVRFGATVDIVSVSLSATIPNKSTQKVNYCAVRVRCRQKSAN